MTAYFSALSEMVVEMLEEFQVEVGSRCREKSVSTENELRAGVKAVYFKWSDAKWESMLHLPLRIKYFNGIKGLVELAFRKGLEACACVETLDPSCRQALGTAEEFSRHCLRKVLLAKQFFGPTFMAKDRATKVAEMRRHLVDVVLPYHVLLVREVATAGGGEGYEAVPSAGDSVDDGVSADAAPADEVGSQSDGSEVDAEDGEEADDGTDGDDDGVLSEVSDGDHVDEEGGGNEVDF